MARRRDEEVCDYCYISRAVQGSAKQIYFSDKYNEKMAEINGNNTCICHEEMSCRDSLCVFGIPLGGQGMPTRGSIDGN